MIKKYLRALMGDRDPLESSLYAKPTLELLEDRSCPVTIQGIPSQFIPLAVGNTIQGTGVTFTSVSYKGNAGSIGRFAQGGADVGINSGIVLDTGLVSSIGGNYVGNTPIGNQTAGGTFRNFDLDPPVQAATLDPTTHPGANGLLAFAPPPPPYPTLDAAVLTLNFVAQGPQVTFNFVFASNEYVQLKDQPFVLPPTNFPTFAMSQLTQQVSFVPAPTTVLPGYRVVRANDYFEPFISSRLTPLTGMVSAGAYANQGPETNSIVPISPTNGLVTPISLLQTNEFISNDPSAGGGAPRDIKFNGLSDILTVTENIVPGRAYTLTLALADGPKLQQLPGAAPPLLQLLPDQLLNSAVFIGAVSTPERVYTAWPTRWVFKPADGTFNGYITLVNLGPQPLVGAFQVTLNFLPTGVSVVGPNSNGTGFWAGNVWSEFNTVTLNPGQSTLIPIKVTNPLHMTLPPYYNIAFTIVPTLPGFIP